jgi:hypothetical protein
MKLKIGLALAIFGFAAAAQAGLIAEPYIGYGTSSTLAYKYGAAGTNYTYNATSIPLGGRVGFMLANGLYFGAEGQYNYSGSLSSTASGYTNSDTFTRAVAGAEIGFKAGRVMFFGGYNPLTNFFLTSTSTTNTLWQLSGSGVFGGLEYIFGNHLSLLVRYDSYTYSTYQSSTTGHTNTTIPTAAAAGAISGTPTDSTIAVMIGFPFGEHSK